MTMIYTLTLNPCLDRHLEVEDLKVDDANRVAEETRYPAGKGIDVSVVIAELGGKSTALGFVGGFAGLELEGMLVNRGVHCEFTRISGETRTNVHIYNRLNKHQTSLNAAGPIIKDAELGALCFAVRNLDPKARFMALSGSVPRGVTPAIYQQVITWARENGTQVALDSDRDPFKLGIAAQPYLIKPNLHELSRYFDEDVRLLDESALYERCARFLDLGVQVVVLSMGKQGLLVRSKEHGFRVRVPEVNVRSTIGSGDSVIAGILYRLDKQSDLVEAARWGAACGTATAMTPGTALCRKEDVSELLNQITVDRL